MAKTVVMPQMGESVAEGTIVRWLKKVGDPVERDEPLFEISTDKVDAEIPSPSAGVLSEIKVQEGQTVPINTVVGVVDETAKATGTPAITKPAATADPGATSAPSASASAPPAVEELRRDKPVASTSAPTAPTATVDKPVAPRAPNAPVAPRAPIAPSTPRLWSAAEARELRLSPVVRKIARTHHIDVRNIAGS